MSLPETLVRALTDRFVSQGLRVGTPPDPLALFPAAHPAVGDLTIRADGNHTVTVVIGEIFGTDFTNYDTHLDDEDRAIRLTKDVVRFLDELFADRLLFWRAADGRGSAWRELGPTMAREPLVLDNRAYHTYLWSGPVGKWQAIPVILGRERIQTERECEIITGHLVDPLTEHFDPAQRELATKLVAEYWRGTA